MRTSVMVMSVISGANIDALCDMARSCPPGDFLEVGVYKGGSAAPLAILAREQGRQIWLFDTFTGIPEATPEVDRHAIGDFGDTSVDEVRLAAPNAQIVVGDATETLPATPTGPLAFVHLDCDQYATYRACISELIPRMVHGGVMWFDDCDHLPGAAKAVHEMFGQAVQKHEPTCKWFVRF